jgi:hypothetical protein
MSIFDDLYDVGGVRSKLPDGSGPDRTPPTPHLPPCAREALTSHDPPPTQHEFAGGRVAFLGQNFDDPVFIVGCCYSDTALMG